MDASAQSLIAPLVVIAALGYLGWTWWRGRKSGSTGCGDSGGCACPKPALPPHLQRR